MTFLAGVRYGIQEMRTICKKSKNDMSPPFRMTSRRRIILEELQRSMAHPTAEELLVRAARSIPGLSLATVYRTLSLLHEAGLVLKLDLDGERSRWDGTISSHSHIICRHCGCIADVPEPSTKRALEQARTSSSYSEVRCRIEFTGVCTSCDSHSLPPTGRNQTSKSST